MAKIPINLSKGTIEKDSPVIVGIDLGTTNSLVAFMKDGKPYTVKDKTGKNALVASIVHFDKKGEATVGNEAKPFLISDPQHTIYSVKRLLGKAFKDIEQYSRYFGYKIINEDTDDLVKIRMNDRFYNPVELSAKILISLKQRVENELSATVRKAVITVPAYFNDAQRQATRDAGKLAGLDVLRIVNEPTAASLAYGIGLQPDESKKVAVYDLGGGTFDISILEIQNGIFEVLATNGNTFLGGDDFDRVLLDYWIESYSIDSQALEDKSFSQQLRLLAEQAKKTLSVQSTFSGTIGQQAFDISLDQFNELIQPLIDQTIQASKQALLDAALQVSDIDDVIMVGGSTRIPLVRDAATRFFGKSVNCSLNPDEVVALGAAIQADILAGNNKDILLIDVTPLSLGIETIGGLMDTIIARNSKVPSRAGRQYTTSLDGQKNLKVAVYQGERDLVSNNRKLGEFVLSGIPPMPAGIPKIEIQFILDADGILQVKASELRSGVAQTIKMHSSYGISEEEMGKMLLESIHNAKDDMSIRAIIEARNEANNVLLNADKFLQQNESILSENEIATTKKLVSELRKTVEEEDKDLINKAMDDLNEFTKPLAHRALDHNITKALSGKKIT